MDQLAFLNNREKIAGTKGQQQAMEDKQYVIIHTEIYQNLTNDNASWWGKSQ